MNITAELLRSKGACRDQVALFEKHFPKGATVTVSRCKKVARIFDWDWAAATLLSDTAAKAYSEACAPAAKAYYEACAPARKAYNEACITALKAYDEACAPASKAYDEACITAMKAYNEACATAFANAAINDK